MFFVHEVEELWVPLMRWYPHDKIVDRGHDARCFGMHMVLLHVNNS